MSSKIKKKLRKVCDKTFSASPNDRPNSWAKRNKKLAVCVSGWHFPAQFYRAISVQRRPIGWEIELFCIAHRLPEHAKEEKKDKRFDDSLRGKIDQKLYSEMITREEMEKIGWKFIEKPNTIGDWGNSNQWLEDYNYKDYDLFLFSHDDNFIINDLWFASIISDLSFGQWDILANSAGMPQGWLRGSCEFFTKKCLRKLGGKFDLSETTLTREGQTTATEKIEELYDWNTTVNPMMKQIETLKLKVGYLSPSYRVSAFCIEGERGYISNTHGANTSVEDSGLNHLHELGII